MRKTRGEKKNWANKKFEWSKMLNGNLKKVETNLGLLQCARQILKNFGQTTNLSEQKCWTENLKIVQKLGL